MRIFVLGTGASGALLAQLLARRGHQVTCGDKDPERARRFLGRKSELPIVTVNARNLRGVVRAARGCQLLVNASPAVFNEVALRAALRLRAHYLDLASHLTRNPFKAEEFAYQDRFAEKRRVAVINAGAAPGLTNLLAARAADSLDEVEAIYIRLYEGTEADDPISQWSHESAFDEAISRPRVVRNGRFLLARRFSEPEKFRFPPPIGQVSVVLAAQDEVGTLPHHIKLKDMDVKFGGNEIDRLRRWYRQGKLRRSRHPVASRFPRTPSPRQVAHLIHRGVLQNARFAAAVIVRGRRGEKHLEIRWDAYFPTLYQIRQRGLAVTPISYATAHMAALFVQNFPRNEYGVFSPDALPAETRRAILARARQRFGITARTARLKEDQQELDLP
jgi:saccharopine dehydrogenase (NAD+, L-lysine-forming)